MGQTLGYWHHCDGQWRLGHQGDRGECTGSISRTDRLGKEVLDTGAGFVIATFVGSCSIGTGSIIVILTQ